MHRVQVIVHSTSNKLTVHPTSNKLTVHPTSNNLIGSRSPSRNKSRYLRSAKQLHRVPLETFLRFCVACYLRPPFACYAYCVVRDACKATRSRSRTVPLACILRTVTYKHLQQFFCRYCTTCVTRPCLLLCMHIYCVRTIT